MDLRYAHVRMGLSVLVYDAACRGPGPTRWLGRAFAIGRHTHAVAQPWDLVVPATTWPEAIDRVLAGCEHAGVAELQYWGHGKWGRVLIGAESLDRDAISPAGPLHDRIRALGTLMHGPDAHVWFRTCETLGAHRGHAMAQELCEQLGCAVAGHTFIVGPWQSGLHLLRPGARPEWPADEGLLEGTPELPVRAAWSRAWHPRTVSCMRRALPTFATDAGSTR